MASIVASENEFCKNPTSKDTITIINSESYDSIGGHKHSLDQHTEGRNPRHQFFIFSIPPEVEPSTSELNLFDNLAEDERLAHDLRRAILQTLQFLPR